MTLLTIAIPTYNRLKYLQELLPELLSQCKPYPEIEILVSNNHSTDGTAEYLKTVPGIETRTNRKNVGGSENVVLCVESARGNYIWLFGDDEKICDSAIDLIMDTLKLYPVSLLIVGENSNQNPFYIGTYSDYITNNGLQDLLNQTLLTCNIFKKDLFDCEVARKYRNTDYGHMYTIMGSLKTGGVIYRIDSPVISIRNHRAPILDRLEYTRIKQLTYLRYLGVPYTKLLAYIGKGIILPSALRQLHKIREHW